MKKVSMLNYGLMNVLLDAIEQNREMQQSLVKLGDPKAQREFSARMYGWIGVLAILLEEAEAIRHIKVIRRCKELTELLEKEIAVIAMPG